MKNLCLVVLLITCSNLSLGATELSCEDLKSQRDDIILENVQLMDSSDLGTKSMGLDQTNTETQIESVISDALLEKTIDKISDNLEEEQRLTRLISDLKC